MAAVFSTKPNLAGSNMAAARETPTTSLRRGSVCARVARSWVRGQSQWSCLAPRGRAGAGRPPSEMSAYCLKIQVRHTTKELRTLSR